MKDYNDDIWESEEEKQEWESGSDKSKKRTIEKPISLFSLCTL